MYTSPSKLSPIRSSARSHITHSHPLLLLLLLLHRVLPSPASLAVGAAVLICCRVCVRLYLCMVCECVHGDGMCASGKFRDIFGYSEVGLITGSTHATREHEARQLLADRDTAAH